MRNEAVRAETTGDEDGGAHDSFAIQALLIAVLFRSIRERPESEAQTTFFSARFFIPVWLVSLVALLRCIGPIAAFSVSAIIIAFVAPEQSFALAPWHEIGNGLELAIAATALAWLAAGWAENRGGWRWLLALPGLLGPLLCGLLLLAVLQVPPLHLLRDTVFPAVLGLALVLLPFALLLRFGIETTRDSAALHTARASGGRHAAWQLDGWPRLCAVLMLFCFGYGDFTINSLLAPPQFTSVSTRLLNLLHYGRSEALMVMFILSFSVPLSAALLTALIARLYPRRRAS